MRGSAQDQEIQRLKHELLALSKKEATQRSAQKTDSAVRSASNGHSKVPVTRPAERTAAVDRQHPPVACVAGGVSGRSSGVFSGGAALNALPPRAKIADNTPVSLDNTCNLSLDILKMSHPSPRNKVDYDAMMLEIYPVYQRIRVYLYVLYNGSNSSLASCGAVSTLLGGTPAAKIPRGTPGGTTDRIPVPPNVSTSSAAANKGLPVYDTPGSHVYPGAEIFPLTRPIRTCTDQNDLSVPTGVKQLFSSLDEFMISVILVVLPG